MHTAFAVEALVVQSFVHQPLSSCRIGALPGVCSQLHPTHSRCFFAAARHAQYPCLFFCIRGTPTVATRYRRENRNSNAMCADTVEGTHPRHIPPRVDANLRIDLTTRGLVFFDLHQTKRHFQRQARSLSTDLDKPVRLASQANSMPRAPEITSSSPQG